MIHFRFQKRIGLQFIWMPLTESKKRGQKQYDYLTKNIDIQLFGSELLKR